MSQGVLLTIVPWVLVLFGSKIRARSKFASVSQLELSTEAILIRPQEILPHY